MKTPTTVFRVRYTLFLLLLGAYPVAAQQDTVPRLMFYGSGNIQKSLEGGEGLPANTGLGVKYTHHFGKATDSPWSKWFTKLDIDAMINVASTVDTIRAEYKGGALSNASLFGASILTPLNSGQAARIGLRMDFKEALLGKLLLHGLKMKYVGSNRNWAIRPGGTGDEEVIQVTNNYFRAGLFHEFLPEKYLGNYSINIGIYFAYNSIKGDIGLKQNRELRNEVLKSYRKNFLGPEVAFEVRLKNLRAEFAYPFLTPGSNMPGLTEGRLITTITFVGGFPLLLKANAEDE